jgi:hypothetical protein
MTVAVVAVSVLIFKFLGKNQKLQGKIKFEISPG